MDSEYSIQVALVEYLELLKSQGKVILFTSIPNSTFTKSWSAKVKNTKTGLRPGFPDLVIIFPNGVLFLELKKEKGSVVSPYQKAWQEALLGRGLHAVIAKGFDAAKQAIDTYV